MGILEWWNNWGQETNDRLMTDIDPRYEPFEYLMHSDEVKSFRDREGKRVTADEWLELHGDMDYRTVAITAIQEPTGEISIVLTCWLGVVLRGKTKFLFETAVMRGALDGTIHRARHERDAHVAHEETTRDVMDACPGCMIIDEYRSY